MARFFITGSSDGLGALTAKRLITEGHQVILHARNTERAKDAAAACPGPEAVLIADLTSLDEIKQLASDANRLGPFEAVIPNAGVYHGMEKVPGKSGLPTLFTVNTLAPYILTCLIQRPRRLVFVSSSMHYGGRPQLSNLVNNTGYSDSKLHNIMLANAFARMWPNVQSNSVDPGWVPTKLGGRSAPDDINVGVNTFVTVAAGEGAAKGQTGKYFANSTVTAPLKVAKDVGLQENLLRELGKISGVSLPQ